VVLELQAYTQRHEAGVTITMDSWCVAHPPWLYGSIPIVFPLNSHDIPIISDSYSIIL
jgi:hypothetical protein